MSTPHENHPVREAEFDQAAVNEVMKKYDRESNTRLWEGWQRVVVYAILAAFSLFVIYVTLFATWLDLIRYPSFMGGILLIGYLVFPAKKGDHRPNHIPWYDWIIMLAGAAAFFYMVINAKSLTVRLGMSRIYPYEIVIAIIGILATLELCRRSVGIPILCVAGIFVIYALYYYSVSKHLGMSGAVRNVANSLFYRVQGGGILGTPVQVCSKFIIVFIVFGAFLERTGISQFFIDLANSLVGRFSGGPAKVAVISSALCGMVSGSSVGNTVTTGSVTIPMMKKTGYKPEFAGAVEAAASTGGQIMPPIMGAAAFLMAEYVGVPYSNIIVRAILPAILYFTGIFIAVHLEAKKLGLKGIARENLPLLKHLIKRVYLLLPLVILVYLVSSGNSTMAFAAAIAILFAVSVSNVHDDLFTVCIGDCDRACRFGQAEFLQSVRIVGGVFRKDVLISDHSGSGEKVPGQRRLNIEPILFRQVSGGRLFRIPAFPGGKMHIDGVNTPCFPLFNRPSRQDFFRDTDFLCLLAAEPAYGANGEGQQQKHRRKNLPDAGMFLSLLAFDFIHSRFPFRVI